MIDSVEDYWDIAHIMMNGSFAATMRNEPAAQGRKRWKSCFSKSPKGRPPPRGKDGSQA